MNWLKHGDKNTRFFHTSVMQRCSINKISGIENIGELALNPQEVHMEFRRHFTTLFSANPSVQVQETVEGIPSKVTDDMNRSFTRSVTDLEIHTALIHYGYGPY